MARGDDREKPARGPRRRKAFAPYHARRNAPVRSSCTRVSPPAGYHCPFCPNHVDDEFFVWNGVLEEAICDGCTYDLLAVVEAWPKPTIPDFAQEIAMLERLSGKSMREIQAVVARREVAEGEDLERMRAVLSWKEEWRFGPPFITRALQVRHDRDAERAAFSRWHRREHWITRRKRFVFLRGNRVTRVSQRFASRRELVAEWRRRLARFRSLLAETENFPEAR